MADYTKQIFEMLGVEPEEEFKLRMDSDYDFLYKLDEKLNIWSYYKTLRKWAKLEDSSNSILKMILTGETKIVKILRLTAEEQLAIDYAKACGCKWMAKDKNKAVFGYDKKPTKYDHNWNSGGVCIKIEIPISFLSWEDEEPYEIEQKETEEKEVCKYYSGGECMGQKYHPSVECKGDKSCCEGDN